MEYIDAKEIAYNVCNVLPNGQQKDIVVYYAIQAAFATAKWIAEQEVKNSNSLQQEQSEVDLEKEYTEFVVADPVYSKLVNGIVGKAIARHFYKLGLKAGKEE